MSSEPVAATISRTWAGVYTRGLPDEVRERRIAELESDLWEHLHDPVLAGSARSKILGRTLRGIHADVWWRYRTLLDQRGARQRSHEMTTTHTSNWWPPLATVVGVLLVAVGLLGLVVGEPMTGGGGSAVASLVPAVAGALVLGGLVVRRSRAITGSRLVVVGSVLAVLSDPILVPVALIVVLGGLWTGDLALTVAADAPDLRATRQSLTAHWYRWLVAAVALAALGFGALVVGEVAQVDGCTEADPCWEDTAVWATWILSWLAAGITGAIGLVLAVFRLVNRHHTRLA